MQLAPVQAFRPRAEVRCSGPRILSFVLDAQGLGRPEQEQYPPQGVFDEKTRDSQDADHALIVPQRSAVNSWFREAEQDGIFAEHRR